MQIVTYDEKFEELITKIGALPNGKKLLDLSGISERFINFNKFTTNFFSKTKSNVADLSVDSNSNIKQRSAITYINEAPKGLFKLNNYYQLWQSLKAKYGVDRANEAIYADITGDTYIADMTLWNIPYCYAFSAMDILNSGMPFITSPKSAPACHLDSFIQHIIQSTMYFSNSIAGAVAYPDIFPAMWFVYQYDKSIGYPTNDPVKFEAWVEQQFQLFVYTVNQPYRSGTQSPFVNISVFDKYFLENTFGGLSWINPKTDEIVDINLEEVDHLQKWFSEWFVRESKKQIFTFPIMTANVVTSRDENGKRYVKDEEFFRWAAQVTIDRALFNLYTGEEGRLSTCCRLRSDAEKMKQFFNSLGSGGTKIGSHRVCTINLPRIAHNSSNIDDFISKLMGKMELARDILKAHRELLEYEIDAGMLPLYTLGFMNLKTQFSTVGILGFYEAMNILGYDMVDESNLKVAKQVIDAMNNKNDEFAERDHVLYNLEQIPGESASVKLAQKDYAMYGEEMHYQMYSNQFLPLVKQIPLAKRIKVQGIFDAAMSGGSILHINIAEKIQSIEMLLTLMNYAVENNVVYFAPNYNMAICSEGHVNVGKLDTCPQCGGPITQNMTRVVGFYTPVSAWKEERRGEIDYKSRKFY